MRRLCVECTEAVASTTLTPNLHYPGRVPRKVHLATLGLKHIKSLVGHRLTDVEAVASTKPIPESGYPLEDLN